MTPQDQAQLFQRKHGDGFVVLQIVDGSGIDAMLVNQGVGSDPFLFHGFPQRFIANQNLLLLT